MLTVVKHAVKVGKGGWKQLQNEALCDLYLLKVVQASIGLHILSAECNNNNNSNNNNNNNNNNNTYELGLNRAASVL